MVKTNGHEFKAFHRDKVLWEGGVFYEDEVIIIDGVQAEDDCDFLDIPDNSVVEISGGVVFKTEDDFFSDVSLESYFKTWLKKQKKRHIIVEVDASKVGEVKKALSKFRCRIY